ncbi:MAG: hypothetical protein KGQ59_05320, partial [Bdellovibrionales bacterium]|nr:hypothetical protein [Bdellovibrionales bacterium]
SLVLIWGLPIAQAQTQTSSPKAASKLRTTAVMDMSSNLYPMGSEAYSASSSLMLMPTYRVQPSWSVGMILSAAKDWNGEASFTLMDPVFKFSHQPSKLNSYLSISPSLGVVLPISERTRSRESMITAIRSSARFSADLAPTRKNVLQNLSVSYELGISRAFHEFSTSSTGSVNTAWRVSNVANLSYAFDSKWSLSADFMRSIGVSYQGGVRHAFSAGESLNYDVDPRLSISVGHSNEGDVLRANGVDSNVSIFDSTSSRVFTSLTVIF